MAGIISGFVKGLSQGVADVGRMTLADKIAREREEANDLRSRALSNSKQEFTAGENQKDRDSRASIADTKADKSGSGKPTNKTKNINDLMSRGLSEKEAILKVYPSSKIDYTDKDGNQVVVIPDGKDANGAVKFKEIGRFVKDEKGTPTWLNKGEELPNAEITSKHRKDAKLKAKEKDKFWEGDKTSFPSTGGDIVEWRRQEAQRSANEERAAAKKGGGIVNGKIKTKSENTLPGGEVISDEKMVGKRKVTKQEFMRRMIKQHGQDKKAEIEKAWNSIK